MAANFQLKCPKCKAVVQTSNPRPPGTKVRCPSCESTFAIPANAAETKAKSQAAVPANDEAGADSDELKARLAEKSRASLKHKKGAAARTRKRQQRLLVGGIAAFLLLCAGGVAVYFMLPSGKSGGRATKVNEENFNQLAPGMTLSQVKEVLGSGDEEPGPNEPPADVRAYGHSTKVFNWFKWRGNTATIYIGMTESGVALARVSVVAYTIGNVSKVKVADVRDADRFFDKGQRR